MPYDEKQAKVVHDSLDKLDKKHTGIVNKIRKYKKYNSKYYNETLQIQKDESIIKVPQKPIDDNTGVSISDDYRDTLYDKWQLEISDFITNNK